MQINHETYDRNGNIISTAVITVSDIPFAKRELDKSDMVAIRCIKANVAFPADWQAYVAALRAVVNGTSTNLPVQPLFPAGT